MTAIAIIAVWSGVSWVLVRLGVIADINWRMILATAVVVAAIGALVSVCPLSHRRDVHALRPNLRLQRPGTAASRPTDAWELG
jgi:hypothetical protein